MNHQPPQDYLSRHHFLHTRDLDEARQVMGAQWTEHEVVVTKGGSFETTVNQVGIGPAALTYVRCPTPLRVTCSPVCNDYLVFLLKEGVAEHALNGHRSIATTKTAVVHIPGQQVEMNSSAARCLALQFPQPLVETGLRSRGLPLRDVHRWASQLDLESPTGKALCGLAEWSALELNRHGSALTAGPAADSLSQTLLNLFLDCLSTKAPSTLSGNGPLGKVAFPDLESWILANRQQPLTVEILAQVAGVSTRAVQSAFRRYRDCTPTQFICRVRLEEIRRQLEAAVPGTSVSELALNHGFFHLGRFSQVYREHFGERPSDTLRRAQGRMA